MPELTLVKLTNRLIQAFEQLEPLRRDSRFHHATVVLLPLPRDQRALFHAVEQPRHVRIVRDHAVSDGAARQTFGLRSAQDPQHVVLGAREPVGFQQLLGLLAQGVGNFLQGNEDVGLQWGGRARRCRA